jgi:hypothetical protein
VHPGKVRGGAGGVHAIVVSKIMGQPDHPFVQSFVIALMVVLLIQRDGTEGQVTVIYSIMYAATLPLSPAAAWAMQARSSLRSKALAERCCM